VSAELAHLATMNDDPGTALRGSLSGRKQVAWAAPIPLAEVKAVGKALGCTINDVLLATLAGAFGAWLRERSEHVVPDSIRALAPVNLRDLADGPELGNRFGLVFAALPIGEPHPIKRLLAVHQDMQALKQSPEPQVAYWLLSALGALPALVEAQAVDLLTRKASLVVSNVPGPHAPLHLGGARIDSQHFWVPQAGRIGVGASLLTYDGQVHFGVIADRERMPEPRHATALFTREFANLFFCVVAAGERARTRRNRRGRVRG
jgi:WS/DGAT/MGAT family acyltransferase